MPKKDKLTLTDRGKKPTKIVKKAGEADRRVIYPEVVVRLAVGKDALTFDQVKDLLHLVEEDESKEKFGDDFLFVNREGKKVRCLNNDHNRPFDIRHARALGQDILNRRWADSRNGEGRTINGEAWIVGRTGRTISCQHRAVGFYDAVQLWRADPAWRKKWPEEPTMEALIVYGVDESVATTRTLDNVRPRTIADAMFCDDEAFRSTGKNKLKASDRERLCKMADAAVKLLWYRTGACLDPFAPRRTNSEALDFLFRHPSVKEAVRHVWEEGKDRGKAIDKIVSLGYASAMMYLMATSGSDPGKYRSADNPSEADLDLGQWDRASDFMAVLADAASPELRPAREVMADLLDPEKNPIGWKPSLDVKLTVLANAWHAWRGGEEFSAEDIYPDFDVPDSEDRVLESVVSVGGIDLGDPVENPPKDDDGGAEGGVTEDEPEEDEVHELTPLETKQEIDAGRSGVEASDPDGNEKVYHSRSQMLVDYEEKYPGRLLIFKTRNGKYTIWGDDALNAAGVLGRRTTRVPDGEGSLAALDYPAEDHAPTVSALRSGGCKVQVIEEPTLPTAPAPELSGGGGSTATAPARKTSKPKK